MAGRNVQATSATDFCAFSLFVAQVNVKDQLLIDDGKAFAEILISESPARGFQSEPSLPLMFRFRFT
jgi:hypothetical protein